MSSQAIPQTPQVYLVQEENTPLYFVGYTDLGLKKRVNKLEEKTGKQLIVRFEHTFWKSRNPLEASTAARNEIRSFLQTIAVPDNLGYFKIPEEKIEATLLKIYDICDQNDLDEVAELKKRVEELERKVNMKEPQKSPRYKP
jgi:hypothetical protein